MIETIRNGSVKQLKDAKLHEICLTKEERVRAAIGIQQKYYIQFHDKHNELKDTQPRIAQIIESVSPECAISQLIKTFNNGSYLSSKHTYHVTIWKYWLRREPRGRTEGDVIYRTELSIL